MIVTVILSWIISLSAANASDNVFNINGKNISLTDELLEEFRGHWEGSKFIKITAFLDKSDTQWIFDFISLREYLLNNKCKELILMETRVFDHSKDIDNVGSHIKAGKFEYMWQLNACSKERKYRIVNEEGTSDFIVYPLNL